MEITPELLKRYYLGQCSTEEQKLVKDWLNNPSSDFDLPSQVSSKERKTIKERVWSKLGIGSTFLRTNYFPLIFRIAAALVVVSGFWWYFTIEQSQVNQNKPVVEQRTVKTQRGQKIRLKLPDSTRIVLNDESEITFPLSFSDTIRKVSLSGQAYFEVTKNPNQPFVVETSQTRVRVLGTAFDLKAYTTESGNKLSVAEGSVRFSDLKNTKNTIVTAGQQADFEKGNLSIATSHISGAPAWSQNIIELNDESLEKIALLLERWYNIQITIKSKKLKEEHYSGTFNSTSLPVVLNSMGYAIGFKYEINGKSITIF